MKQSKPRRIDPNKHCIESRKSNNREIRSFSKSNVNPISPMMETVDLPTNTPSLVFRSRRRLHLDSIWRINTIAMTPTNRNMGMASRSPDISFQVVNLEPVGIQCCHCSIVYFGSSASQCSELEDYAFTIIDKVLLTV